jgi:hypothetical protein
VDKNEILAMEKVVWSHAMEYLKYHDNVKNLTNALLDSFVIALTNLLMIYLYFYSN